MGLLQYTILLVGEYGGAYGYVEEFSREVVGERGEYFACYLVVICVPNATHVEPRPPATPRKDIVVSIHQFGIGILLIAHGFSSIYFYRNSSPFPIMLQYLDLVKGAHLCISSLYVMIDFVYTRRGELEVPLFKI